MGPPIGEKAAEEQRRNVRCRSRFAWHSWSSCGSAAICSYTALPARQNPWGRQRCRCLARSSGGCTAGCWATIPPLSIPPLLTDIYGRAVVSQIFDGLVQFDANLKPIPALAEFWEASRDGRTWTFTLRRGVKFHHGREVTAHDVVYSFTRLLDPTKPVPVTELFRRIQGAKEFMQGKTTSRSRG